LHLTGNYLPAILLILNDLKKTSSPNRSVPLRASCITAKTELDQAGDSHLTLKGVLIPSDLRIDPATAL